MSAILIKVALKKMLQGIGNFFDKYGLEILFISVGALYVAVFAFGMYLQIKNSLRP